MTGHVYRCVSVHSVVTRVVVVLQSFGEQLSLKTTLLDVIQSKVYLRPIKVRRASEITSRCSNADNYLCSMMFDQIGLCVSLCGMYPLTMAPAQMLLEKCARLNYNRLLTVFLTVCPMSFCTAPTYLDLHMQCALTTRWCSL